MKYKVGDKVRIRKDLIVDESYDEREFTEEMEKDVKANDYILTISKAYIAYDKKTPVYRYEEDTLRTNYSSYWELTESMIEGLVVDKFRAFLREVVCGSLLVKESPYNNIDTHEFDIGMDINNAMKKICNPNRENLTHEEVEKVIDKVVEVYAKFEPTIVDTAKKMTKAEIEAELGYEIEIVEG